MRISLDIVSVQRDDATKDNAIAKDKLDFLMYIREECLFHRKSGLLLAYWISPAQCHKCGTVLVSAAAKFTFATKNKVARG